MARPKNTVPNKQLSVAIPEKLWKAVDDMHWDERVEIRDLVIAALEAYVGDVAPDDEDA